ncbi:MAG TPA: hypothetical protein VGB42_10005 [Candidatus Thermoplasmatota archaeon]
MPVLRGEPFMEGLKNRMSKKRKRVAFELTKDKFEHEGTDVVRMYDDQGTLLGQAAFTLDENEMFVQALTVDDWTEEASVVERMVKFLELQAKRRRLKRIRAELYVADARSTEKIEKVKALGWKAQDVGRMGQRTSYTLVKEF